MGDWLHNLPVRWMALVIFAIVYLATGVILAIIFLLATGERTHVFKRVSPGLLSPWGLFSHCSSSLAFFRFGATSIAP